MAPPFNIVCFRLEGPDELQLELRKRLLEAGEFYITTTQFRGRRWLRLTLINPETEPEDVRALLAELERLRRANATGMQL